MMGCFFEWAKQTPQFNTNEVHDRSIKRIEIIMFLDIHIFYM